MRNLGLLYHLSLGYLSDALTFLCVCVDAGKVVLSVGKTEKISQVATDSKPMGVKEL